MGLYLNQRLSKSIRHTLFVSLALVFTASLCVRDIFAQQTKRCTAAIGALNRQFTTIKGLDKNGNLPLDSGLILHTIHGPGTITGEMDMKALNALPVDASKTCGDFINGIATSSPVFLPWCGSNNDPKTGKPNDSSSWSYIRQDTLINGRNSNRPNEVVCQNDFNKRYGLIFRNSYMNENDNLGCMYPLDGDTGNRANNGCGISVNKWIVKTDAQGACPLNMTLSQYEADFQNLLTDNGGQYRSYAGSLICSLSKPQFGLWVDARKKIDLSYTDWPVNEFILRNWETYSTRVLAKKKYLAGIYYLTGCDKASDGNAKDAQAIADLYKKWSGVDLPVVNLSNSAMRAKSSTPFSCL